jgi:glycosyltransferase involved in cell wall biosynthesis
MTTALPGPLVSIGVPVYNGEPFLPTALDMLLGQTYPHLEVIISDNASTDRTAEICRAYAARDPRVKYHPSSVNVGVYANFRRVIALSSGSYFMWAAVDDVRSLTVVEECVAALERDARAVLAHGIIQVRSAGGDLTKFPNDVDLGDPRPAVRIRTFINGKPNNAILYGLYRRQALQRGVLGSWLGQDYLLSLQMCLVGPFAYTRTPLITYTERKAVTSSSPMYTELPLTLRNLFKASRVYRRKCWVVWLMGIYCLATVDHAPWSDRGRAIVAHILTFGRVYRSRLAREVVFQACEPLAWMANGLWRLLRPSPMLRRLLRRPETPGR